jgi:hypothetical protein
MWKLFNTNEWVAKKTASELLPFLLLIVIGEPISDRGCPSGALDNGVIR